MNSSIFSQQPEFALALIILLVLQIVVIILLINLHLKISTNKAIDLKTDKPPVDNKLKQVNERLRDDERRQEQIRRNYDENRSPDKDQRPPFKGPQQNHQDRNFNRNNRDNRDNRDHGRDRDRGFDKNRDNRDRNREQDRNRNRNDFNRPGGNFRPQFDKDKNREGAIPSVAPAAPIMPVSIETPKPEVRQEERPQAVSSAQVAASETESDFSHGRRPIVKRRNLSNETVVSSETNSDASDVPVVNVSVEKQEAGIAATNQDTKS